jgi:hypothetical protein
MSNRAQIIRALNDDFRSSMFGGRVVETMGVYSLPHEVRQNALQRVRTFSNFEDDNDPHQEHDAGFFELEDHRFMWKIDYYDEVCEYGSEDPTDPSKTTRVLTVLLASEY